jgi:hypothetical protein
MIDRRPASSSAGGRIAAAYTAINWSSLAKNSTGLSSRTETGARDDPERSWFLAPDKRSWFLAPDKRSWFLAPNKCQERRVTIRPAR